MSIFESIRKAAQETITAKTEEITKQVDAFTKQMETDPAGTVATLFKEKRKQKPDRSIKVISKQILVQRDSIIRNGFKEYEFIASHDCCEVCAMLNGKHFPVSKLKVGVNAPPMHEGCKCSIAAYEDEDKYEAWLNSL